MGKLNPVDHVTFYRRGSASQGGHVHSGRIPKERISCFVPSVFQETCMGGHKQPRSVHRAGGFAQNEKRSVLVLGVSQMFECTVAWNVMSSQHGQPLNFGMCTRCV